MLRLAGKGQCRRSRLNSNVRPRVRPCASAPSLRTRRLPCLPALPSKREAFRTMGNATEQPHRLCYCYAAIAVPRFRSSGRCSPPRPCRAAQIPLTLPTARSGAAATATACLPAVHRTADHASCWRQFNTPGAQLMVRKPSQQSARAPILQYSHRPTRPNPSFEPTPNGIALGPRSALVHDAPRGPNAIPSVAAQLQR
jgi:hypothetical protein